MYLNSNGHSTDGNGHKRQSIFQRDELGVGVTEANGMGEAQATKTEDEPREGKHSGHLTKNYAEPEPESGSKSLLDEDDEPASAELLNVEERRSRLKRVLVAGGLVISLIAVVAVVAYLWLLGGGKSEMEYQVKNPPVSTQTQSEGSAQTLTVEEIRRELNKSEKANPAAPNNQPSVANAPNSQMLAQGGTPVTDRLPLDYYSTTVNPNTQAQNSQATTVGSQATPSESAATTAKTSREVPTASGANTERSVRVSPPAAKERENAGNFTASSTTSDNRAPQFSGAVETSGAATSVGRAADVERTTIALPPLGTMLPVRTLGTIYTLRTDSYVRMQLTRDAGGNGWSLKRGTQLYGSLRGSEFEAGRAYIALIGFVDPDTNRLVRLQGNLLGSDGTDGLKGKKHNLNSGWSRALKVAGAGVIDALGGVAGTLGRRPVYVGDIYGYGAPRAYSPLLQELNGIAYRNGRGGFVEVPAGTTGYLLVMTSPREMQGVDADVNQPIDDANQSSIQNVRRSNERLSEDELAELLTKGDAEDVRQALPRMTPEMRRVAGAVLKQMR